MKYPILLFFGLLLRSSLLTAQIPVFELQWDKKAGGTDDDIIATFMLSPDSGFILCGTSFSGISGDKTQANHDTSQTTSDFWIVKTDNAGVILWDKRYGGNLTEVLIDATVTSDGGIASGGQSYSGIDGDKTEPNHDSTMLSNDYWIVKTDESGIVQWDKRFGGSSYELFGSIRQVADGGFIISGSSFSGADGDKSEASQGGWDFWIVRTDATGNKLWDKRFGGTGDEFSTSLEVTVDGDYLVAGYSNSGISGDKSEVGRGSTDYWVVKVNDAGVKLWDKTLGGNYNDWLFAISLTDDGGYIFGGQSFSEATGDKTTPNHDPAPSGSDRWIVKTDSDGNKLWDRTIGGMATDDLSRIARTSDGGYLLSGESYSQIGGDKTEANLGPEQTWVVKTDSLGLVLWDKTIFTDGHDEAGSAIPYGDDCFIAVNFTQADTGGYKSELSWGYGDYWMVKMCDLQTLSLHETGAGNTSWLCYPNPVTDVINIVSHTLFRDVTIQLFDASGKLVEVLNNLSGADGSVLQIDSSNLPKGIYVCRVIDAQNVFNIRIVKTG